MTRSTRAAIALILLAIGSCSTPMPTATVPVIITKPPTVVGTIQTMADGATAQVMSAKMVDGDATIGDRSHDLAAQVRVCVTEAATISLSPWTARDSQGTTYPPEYVGAGMAASMTPLSEQFADALYEG